MAKPKFFRLAIDRKKYTLGLQLRCWCHFLLSPSHVMVFGSFSLLNYSAIMDGIDMDIEGGRGDNYPVFIKELRKLMDNDPKRNYQITGAPQCPYPDHYLGPERPGSGNRAVFLFVV